MMCKVVQRGGVYTGLSKGASGILFSDNGNQGLPVEDWEDPKRRNVALSHQRGQPRFVERMEDPVTDRFPQAGTIVKERLRLGAELVLTGLPEMSTIER